VKEGAAALQGTTAVAENAVAVGESGSRSRSRSMLRASQGQYWGQLQPSGFQGRRGHGLPFS
jgi:hypothetical protein